MTYTVLTLILVGFILLFWLYNLMYNCFSKSFCVLKNQNNGSVTTKDASIISVTTLKKSKKPLLELLLLFENFSGHHIHRKLRVWDSKPQLNRFEPDKTIPIGLNIARKPKDPVFLSQQMCRFSFVFVIICSLKTIIYVTGCYVLMSEALERIFSEPNRYELIFKSSNTWQIGIVLIPVSVLFYLLLQKIGVLSNGKAMTQNWNSLYYGTGATAIVSGYRKTGTFIKGNPLIQFHYTFKTHNGQIVEGNDTKIMENNQSPQDTDHLEVMYLPNNPSVSRITENLESMGFNNILNILFMVLFFIFSAVFLFSFYQTVFGT
ncbi:hypothetical protein [Allomuricauda sp. F6463D]|uniref:hypothetical protein n=1 Tax=Allomuricauda sp. F6463D TaxID=2926409 RepID=UPI001FF2B933|nr:hypothetical protein [Muricauda sp. F6463D]MCK0161239.1 hypothetical protein [Muricauda sp. F6463D]